MFAKVTANVIHEITITVGIELMNPSEKPIGLYKTVNKNMIKINETGESKNCARKNIPYAFSLNVGFKYSLNISILASSYLVYILSYLP